MIIPIATLALATHLTVTVADNVPSFNVEPLCRGIAEQGGLDLEPNETVPQSINSCVASEMDIRNKLIQEWSTFMADDKAECASESSAGGIPSYTELLTCLEMARDAEKPDE
ncbi:MAG TPA: hypothetical protein VGJ20_12880 [Xanthobacteraceae bacterium]|jgi:hypothetical protein